MFNFFLAVVGALLVLYWLSVWLRSDKFWNWAFGPFDLPSDTLGPPEPPRRPPPATPRPRRDFGVHMDPLSMLPRYQECHGLFEQVDERTWQCPICYLVRFEKP